jgi:multidrug resistance efflux pump
MTDNSQASAAAGAGSAGGTPKEVNVSEIDVVQTEAPASPVRKIVLIALGVLLALFVYHVLSDRYTPYTSQARVETFLTQVAPEVAGDVLEVGAKDNSSVKKGQLLFRIDPEPYQVAMRSAEANLSVALQAADVSVADIAAARAQVRKQRVDLAASQQLGKIVTDLVGQRALAETQGIRARADVGKTAADVTKSEADLRRAEANLGAPGLNNPKVKQALAALDQARLDLRNTTVVAPADGTVTNLRLSKGQYVGPGQPLLSFLETGPRWISADMRENQLGNVRPGQDVLIALDILPGKLFHGRVHSVGWGVSQGDEAPTGQLSSMPADQGWLRDPQQFPVRILLLPEDAKEAGIDVGRSGAQANVMIFTKDKSIMNPIGRLWIKVVALLSYLQ